jgi:ADP-ribose pyrophosphatase YjhB (NUDIX family)
MNNKKYNYSNKNNYDNREIKEPITSWGIILVDVSSIDNKNIIHKRTSLKNKIYNICLRNKHDLEKISTYMQNIKFLLIQRRHSIGFMDFIRGKYKLDNVDQINSLFQYMHQNEIDLLKIKTFEELWNEIWNNYEHRINNLKREFIIAQEKFDKLKNGIIGTDIELNLDFFIKNVKPLYNFLEWGFPKGRRDKTESTLDCALREFSEETNIDIKNINVINEIEPIEENLIGTNGVSYRHIYYIAEIKNNTDLKLNNNNEIGNIGFFQYNTAQNILRDYHVEKKNILENIYMYYLEILLDS